MLTLNLARLLMIDLSGPSLTDDERAFLSQRRPGGVCLFGRNVIDRIQVADYVAELRSLAGPALIVAVDQEGGGVVRLTDLPYPPSAMALGAAGDPQLTFAVAAATGNGLRSLGINVDFAPVADVNSNPRNPVIADRSFGADPERVAAHVRAFVRGLQEAGVAATAKHFPGHGDVAVDSHLELPTLDRSPETLERLELRPFRAAVEAGTAAVMSAHIVLRTVDPTRPADPKPPAGPQLPATLSAALLTGLLRERLGFGGVVFTDSLDMKAIAGRWGAAEAASAALAAGADMPVHVGPVREHEEILRRIELDSSGGPLDPASLEASVARLERLVGSFPPRPDPTAAWRDGDETLLAEAARRSLVSLGRLPRLTTGSRVLLVAAEAVRQGAATQSTVRPAGSLGEALRGRGLVVEEIAYSPEGPMTSAGVAVAAARAHDALIFASTARTALLAEEVELARLLAGSSGNFVHLALWNPYAAAEVPGPALVTFGWRDGSIRAAAAALTGEPVSGVAPIPLRTFDDIEA